MGKLTVIALFMTLQFSFAQNNLQELLQKYNKETVPYITVAQLKNNNNRIVLLDAREPKEFQVSHLNNAICVGYNHFNLTNTLQQLPKNKNATIIVYCSLGIRSETIGEKLLKAGYKNVYNLYGGIFEWKNQGNTIFNSKNNPTEKVHAFDKNWGAWLKKGTKIYD